MSAQSNAPETSPVELIAAFQRGEYNTVAMANNELLWEIPAAKGLIGLTQDAVNGLDLFDSDNAKFYKGVSLWIGGDENGAVAEIENIKTPEAHRLLDIISIPRIRVLAMLPDGGGTSMTLREGASFDKKFDIINIGFGSDDRPNRINQPIEHYLDSDAMPAFFLCQMIEWHQFPYNLSNMPCPLIGQTSDFFVNIQTVQPWLNIFDHIIVNDHNEHREVSKLVSGRVSSFPKSIGVPFSFPDFDANNERPIDVLVTGTTLSPYHPEKAEILRQLLEMKGVEVAVVNGHITSDAYYDLLARSKFTISHYRCGGGLMTRSLEAGALGCIPLVQKNNVTRLFCGSEPSIVEYEVENDGVSRAVTLALRNYSTLQKSTYSTSVALRKELNPIASASQYLRFATFLAAKASSNQRAVSRPRSKRSMFWKGWTPGNGNLGVIHALRVFNAQKIAEELVSHRTFNDIAREMLLELGSRQLKGLSVDLLICEILSVYRLGLEMFPRSLVLRFNAIRAYLHYGDQAGIKIGIDLATQTFTNGDSVWDFDATDDVLPYDYASNFFNYRAYLDLVTVFYAGDNNVIEQMRPLILASLAHYIAKVKNDISYARLAIIYDGDFPLYRLTFAKLLCESSIESERAEAIHHLEQLCNNVLTCTQALNMLKRLKIDGVLPDSFNVDGMGLAHRLVETVTDTESYILRQRDGFLTAVRVASGGHRGVYFEYRQPYNDAMEGTVVIVDQNGSVGQNILDTMNSKSAFRRKIEIVYIDAFDTISSYALQSSDIVSAYNPDGCLPHVNRAANEGAILARTQRLLFFSDNFFAGMSAASVCSYIEKMILQLPIWSPLSSPFIVADYDQQYQEIGALCVRRTDFHHLGGFDPHHAYYGAPLMLSDVVRRAILLNIPCRTPDGLPISNVSRRGLFLGKEVVRKFIFPGIDLPSRAWPRHESIKLGSLAPG